MASAAAAAVAAAAAAAVAAAAAAAAAAVHRAALQGSATSCVMRSAAGVGAADAAAAARKRRASVGRGAAVRAAASTPPAAAADAPAAPGSTGRPGSHRLHRSPRAGFAAAVAEAPLQLPQRSTARSTVNAAPCACIDGEVRAHPPPARLPAAFVEQAPPRPPQARDKPRPLRRPLPAVLRGGAASCSTAAFCWALRAAPPAPPSACPSRGCRASTVCRTTWAAAL